MNAIRSVAPPGWVSPQTRSAAPASAKPEPERALSARIDAAIIDTVILGVVFFAILVAVGGPTESPMLLLPLAVLGVLYHAGFELLRDGQTIGKRCKRVRVVRTDGRPLDVRTVALRGLLRFVDELPVWYASGLVSLWRTGPKRRQRLGDVVAGTLVVPVAEGLRRERNTRGLLPVATILALLMSGATLYAFKGGESYEAQRAAFMSNCDGREISCGCLFDQLREVYGYRGAGDLAQLKRSINHAVARNRPADLPADYVSALRTCRR